MEYPLENLDPERFQEFCQALLARTYPDLQCFPVGQPDGGRDAWIHRRHPSGGRPALFQIKFVRRPDINTDSAKKLLATMKTELKKLSPQILKSVEKYVLITNISGSSHSGTGTIDKMQALLDTSLQIPGEVWWRNDINRRLDGAWDVKWAYPEVMTGQDLLRALVESSLNEDQARRANSVRAFLSDQFRADQEVKFKQVELQNKLVELFVDVPASPPRRSSRGHDSIAGFTHAAVADAISAESASQAALRASPPEEVVGFLRDSSGPVGAASLLLHPLFQKNVPKIVLEGAPGQGKSTIGQYVCQVHRARLLADNDTLEKIPTQHKSGPIRLPFRIDLRDLALWLSRRDPFNADSQAEPSNWQKSVESFLCAQVRNGSGGADFSVSDLQAILRTSPILVIFDGLDEVAEIQRRTEVVDEIKRATSRLKDLSLSIQVVVTSRPAAFANSPGPSEEEFPYFHLNSLPQGLVVDYSERWLKAKRLSEREAAVLRRLLREKLEQAHMRDLSRNPMQLAILLSLMHTRGASLPDKRTALYDNYVDLFFNREAEKSETVRDHRDLLLGIHGHLAWLLQGEAQEGSTSGSITDERLREVVRRYLLTEGHDATLVEVLFTGMIERVVALVSRVQGTYEFEVQPLREFFAARYLYETAPYSPTGSEMRGTRPDRFDALARDYYWLNVTRFYAGCFSKGELPSLVDRLEALLQEAPFKHTSHPRVLSAMLLSDWVFSQHPRSVTKLVDLILNGGGLRAVAAVLNNNVRAPAVLVLPKSSGRDELVRRAFTVLATFPARDYALELIEVLRANGTADSLQTEWRSQLVMTEPEQMPAWMEYGRYLGILSKYSDADLLTLLSPLSSLTRTQLLFSLRRQNVYAPRGDTRSEEAVTSNLLNLDLTTRVHGSPAGIYERLGTLVDIGRYCTGFYRNEPYPLRFTWRHLGDDGAWLDEGAPDNPRMAALFSSAKDATLRHCSEWRTSLSPWSQIVESIRDLEPRAWSATVLAVVAAGITSKSPAGDHDGAFFNELVPLCARMRAARLRAGNISWWTRTCETAKTAEEAMRAVVTAAVWASGRTLLALQAPLERLLLELGDEEWSKLAITLERVQNYLSSFGRGRTAASYAVDRIPVAVSDRSLVIFAPRATTSGRRSLYLDRLAAYRGTARATLSMAQSVALELMRAGECEWDRELACVRHAYSNGIVGDGIPIERAARDWIPREVAMGIVDAAEKYPSALVMSAQAVCARFAAAELIPVGKAARDASWF